MAAVSRGGLRGGRMRRIYRDTTRASARTVAVVRFALVTVLLAGGTFAVVPRPTDADPSRPNGPNLVFAAGAAIMAVTGAILVSGFRHLVPQGVVLTAD